MEVTRIFLPGQVSVLSTVPDLEVPLCTELDLACLFYNAVKRVAFSKGVATDEFRSCAALLPH